MKIETNKFHAIINRKITEMPLSRRNITLARLLSYYQSACKDYPNEILLSNYLHEFYGLEYINSVSTIGSKIMYIQSIVYADPKYIDDESYTNKRMSEVFDTITTPLINNNSFDLEQFNIAKRNYIIDLNENINESVKASKRLIHLYFNNTIRDFSSDGDLSILRELTIDDLYSFYLENKNNAYIHSIGGNVEDIVDPIDTMEKQSIIPFKMRNELKRKTIIDKRKTKVAYLTMVIDPYIFTGERLYDALCLYNYFLGQSGYSMLFKRVREKDNLCYSIYSTYLGASGIVLISAQIDKSNYKNTVNSIKETIKHSLDSFDLDDLKDKYIKQNRPNPDSLNAIVTNKIDTIFFNLPSNDTFEDRINNITMNDIKEIYELFNNISFTHLYGGDKE